MLNNFDPDKLGKDLAHPKPGPKVKKNQRTKRSVKTNNIEKPYDLHCRRCGATTNTECYRHYEGWRKHEIGKGTGQKVNHKATAFLCIKCDSDMSTNPDRDDELAVMKHSEEWFYLIWKTWNI